MQGWERMTTLSIRRPRPHATNQWKEEKEKIVEWKTKRNIRLGEQEGIGSALKARQFTTANTGS